MLIFVHGLYNKVDRCSVMLIDMNYMKHNKISDEIVEKIIVLIRGKTIVHLHVIIVEQKYMFQKISEFHCLIHL